MFFRSSKIIAVAVLAMLLLILSQLPQLITAVRPLSHQGQVQTQLYLPATASPGNPAPLLVFLGGSEGGMSMTNSRSTQERQQYLDAGFALLVIGYFGLPGTPTGLDRIELSGIIEAINNTTKKPAIKAEKLAVIGVSKGAELALVLASQFHQFSTVISVVGSDVVFGSPEWYSTSSSWSWQQQPLAFLPFTMKSAAALTQGDYRRGHEIAMQDQERYQQAKIPVEQMKADVLFISGTADELWPSSEMSDRMMSRLQQHHYKFRSQHLKVSGAGHGGLGRIYQQDIITFIQQSH